MVGIPEVSSRETNASVDPSADSAMWLTSPGTEMANSMRVFGAERCVPNHVTAVAIAAATSTVAHRYTGTLLGAAAIRVPPVSDPQRALSANDKSFAD